VERRNKYELEFQLLGSLLDAIADIAQAFDQFKACP